jgi:hypothetical protein
MISTLPVAQAIVHAALMEQASLVAIASQSTLSNWLVRRSIARDVMRAANVPVWILPNQERKEKGVAAAPNLSLARQPLLQLKPAWS